VRKWVWFGNGGEDEGRMVLISFQWNHGEMTSRSCLVQWKKLESL